MKKFKPLNLLNNKSFWPEKAALVDAIREVLTLGKCRKPLPVSDYGYFRARQWRNDKNELVPYQSVDWYVYDALNEERMQVDSDRILKAFASEPYRSDRLLGDHYDLFVMEEDMFDPSEPASADGPGYTVGKAQKLTAAVISTYRIEHIWGLTYSYLKTEVMRQICYMFGIPSPGRDDVVLDGDRAYCTHRCILRPARVAPDDWDMLTGDRLAVGPFCEPCTQELRKFFAELVEEAK